MRQKMNQEVSEMIVAHLNVHRTIEADREQLMWRAINKISSELDGLRRDFDDYLAYLGVEKVIEPERVAFKVKKVK